MDPLLKDAPEGLDDATMYIDLIIRYLENVNKTVESAEVRRQINHMRSLFILFKDRVEYEEKRNGRKLTWDDFRKWILEEEPLNRKDQLASSHYYLGQND